MKYDDVVKLWGYNILTSHGHKNIEANSVSVELGYEEGGGCETCSYMYGTVTITAGHKTVTIEEYEFSTLLNDLVALSAENADKIIKSNTVASIIDSCNNAD